MARDVSYSTMEDGKVEIKVAVDDKDSAKRLGDLKTNLGKVDSTLKKASDTEKKATKALGDLSRGVKQASGEFKSGSQSVEGFASKLSAMKEKLAGSELGEGVKRLCGTVKDFVSEGVNLYNVQLKSEQALSASAENNPYLNGESVERLKSFASELQSVSEVGDETSLKLMAQLSASGRTEGEIREIMRASVDLSASGLMDIQSAVTQLNATYSGITGTLGRQVGAVRNLTAEELKRGDAVKLVAKQYAGMGEKTANLQVQFQNAFGDLKESVGRAFKPAIDSLAKAGLSVANAISGALNGKLGEREAESLTKEYKKVFSNALKEAGEERTEKRKEASFKLSVESEMLGASLDELLAMQSAMSELVSKGGEFSDIEGELYKELSDAVKTEKERLRNASLEKDATERVNKMLDERLSKEKEVNESITKREVAEKLLSEWRATERDAESEKSAKEASRLMKEAINKRAELKRAERELEKNIYTVDLSELEEQKKRLADVKQEIIEQNSIIEKLSKKTQPVRSEDSKNRKEAELSPFIKTALEGAVVNARDEETEATKRYDTALKQALATLEMKARAEGREVTLSERLDAYMTNYLSIIGDVNGALTENSEVTKKRLSDIRAMQDEEARLVSVTALTSETLKLLNEGSVLPHDAEKLKTVISDYSKLKTAVEALSDAEKENFSRRAGMSVEDALKKITRLESEANEKRLGVMKDALDRRIEYIEDSAVLEIDRETEKNAKLAELEKAYQEESILSKEEYEKRKKAIETQYHSDSEVATDKHNKWAVLSESEKAEQVMGWAAESADVAMSACNLASEQNQKTRDAELSELDEKYQAGLISEEEYYQKKNEIEKAAAKKEYQIQMFSWTAQLLAATANIAQGVTKAIAEQGPMGIISGALVAAAGAIQLASIIASKPVAPSFEKGGIVGGTSYYGDKVSANVNSGEMILTRAQQRHLFDMINVQGGGIVINNTESDRVRATARRTERETIIDIIDARVTTGLASGAFDVGLDLKERRDSGSVWL